MWSVRTEGSELAHYGVKGMKWGVRKDRPTFGERRQVRKLKGNYRSALKNVKIRTTMADSDRQAVRDADAYYEKQQKKGVGIRKSTKEKRMANIQNAEVHLNKKYQALEIAEKNQERSMDILEKRSRELSSYVKSLNDKYGTSNVKQLKTRSKEYKIGQDFVLDNVYKTGIRKQDLPIIGKRVVGKQIAQWEREERNAPIEYTVDDERRKKR